MKRISGVVRIFTAGLCLVLLSLAISGCGGPSRDKLFEQAEDAYYVEDYTQAISLAEQALAARSGEVSDADVLNLLGASFDSLGDFDKAVSHYRKSLAEDDGQANVWTNLGVSLRMQGDYPQAAQAYERALEINPDYPEAHSSLGTLRLVEGDAQASLEHFEKAIALRPNLAVTHGNYAMALAMVGRFADAQAALEQARVLGYQNAAIVQQRIEALEDADQSGSPHSVDQ